jgi:hypothetical protein
LPLAIPFAYENTADTDENREAKPEASVDVEAPQSSDRLADAREDQFGKAAEAQPFSVYSAPSFLSHRELVRAQNSTSERYVTHSLSDQAMSYLDREERGDDSDGLGAYTFVEPAKWTVISTGAILWTVRVCQLAAALASTARAWSHFDPVVIIQQSQLSLIEDEDTEADGFTEKMFDNQNKAKSNA